MTNYQIYQTQFCSYSVSPIAGFWSHETYCNIGAGIWACFQVGYLNREIIIYITTKSTTIIDALDHPNHPLCLVYFGYMGWIPPSAVPPASLGQLQHSRPSVAAAAKSLHAEVLVGGLRKLGGLRGLGQPGALFMHGHVMLGFTGFSPWKKVEYMGITKKEMRRRWNTLRKSAGNRGFCPSDFGDFLCILPSTNSEI